VLFSSFLAYWFLKPAASIAANAHLAPKSLARTASVDRFAICLALLNIVSLYTHL